MSKPRTEYVDERLLQISSDSDGDIIVRGVCGKGYRMARKDARKFILRLKAELRDGINLSTASRIEAKIL